MGITKLVFDPVSLSLVTLTAFVFFVGLASSQVKDYSSRSFFTLSLILEFGCILSFFTSSALTYFIVFEVLVLPVFFVVGYWGSRSRRLSAAMVFYLYTGVGSVMILIGLIYDRCHTRALKYYGGLSQLMPIFSVSLFIVEQ